MISMGGQRCRIAAASVMPSMAPGMSRSVKTTRIGSALENGDRLGGAPGLDRVKPGVLDRGENIAVETGAVPSRRFSRRYARCQNRS